MTKGEIEHIRSTDLFHAGWYGRQYPDVAATGLDGLEHYLRIGAYLRRAPNPQHDQAYYREEARQIAQSCLFDADWYVRRHPDVAHTGLDPLEHYLRLGAPARRDPNPLFSAGYYLENNANGQSAARNPLKHYLEHGWRKGLRPHPGFDVQWYLQRNPDVARAGMEPLRHYLRHGQSEGRAPNPQVLQTHNKKLSLAQQIKTSHEAILRYTSLGIRVLRSGVFDGAWYLRQHPVLAETKWPAIYHYVARGCTEDPSRDFCAKEYLHMNPDVARARIPAILHYERFGKATGRLTSLLETGREPTFPPGALEYTQAFDPAPEHHRRAAVFASYSSDGTIQPYVLHYLKGLKEVCDNIVFVTDCPLYPEEATKLRGLVRCMLVSRHGEYDFGSYKRGWDWLCTHDGLQHLDELLFCNDSCCGPFHPFAKVFSSMKDRPCDFWGLSGYYIRSKQSKGLKWHFQSFFLVFKRNVLGSSVFQTFMSNIRKLPEPTRENTVETYEFAITSLLEDAGFAWASYIPCDFHLRHGGQPTYYGATLMTDYGMPLMKVKSFGDTPRAESPRKILRVTRKLNPELHNAFLPYFRARRAAARKSSQNYSPPRVDFSKHQASFAAKVDRVRQRLSNDHPARVTFLVGSTSMFPSLPLFQAMKDDPAFAPRIVVIPGPALFTPAINSRIAELRALLPGANILSSKTNITTSPWLDVSEDSDLVVYNSPYSLSHFFYDPRYSYGRNFLPLHVNYGYYRSIYDLYLMRMDSYAYFWKAFFENEEIIADYRRQSVIGGSNAELPGYIKMDSLATKRRRSCSERLSIMIAPHHSVEGGNNDVLQLANFIRYEDFFLNLPAKYPSIDFLFRPHPALFNMLSRPDHWGGERAAKWQERFRANPNVRWSEGPDYLQDFADSDGIIQDCGSFLVEYFYTGKPCCYMLKSVNDINRKFTPFGRNCLDHCYLAYEEADITQFIDQVIIGRTDPLSERRQRFSSDKVMINYPKAAQAALLTVKDQLGLSA